MKKETLEAALRKYPLEGWDENIEIQNISRQKLMRTIQKLLEEHGQFPVPWGTTSDYPGLFVVREGKRFLGYSGFAGHETDDDADDLPPLALSVEDLVDARNASEIILDCHFAEKT